MNAATRKILTLVAVIVLFICLIVPEVGSLAESARINTRTNVVVQEIQTLLTNGKTTSAINSKKTEVLAEEIKALIQNGKTAGAVQSANAAKASAEGLVILHQAEQLIGSEIAGNHASGLVTREILCDGAMDSHPTDLTIKKLCATA